MKSSATQPEFEEFKLLLDETLAGKSIVNGLREKGIPAVPLQQVAQRGISDEEVAETLGRHSDFILLTRDRDFRYHTSVKERLQAMSAGVFVITSAGNKTGKQIVELVADAWNRMLKFTSHTPRPFVAKVTGKGKVELHR